MDKVVGAVQRQTLVTDTQEPSCLPSRGVEVVQKHEEPTDTDTVMIHHVWGGRTTSTQKESKYVKRENFPKMLKIDQQRVPMVARRIMLRYLVRGRTKGQRSNLTSPVDSLTMISYMMVIHIGSLQAIIKQI